MEGIGKIAEVFAKNVFNDSVMKSRLSPDVYKELIYRINNNEPLSLEIANAVALEMKDWALENGATHYTHWFQPMTGVTAEKHDSFLDVKNGQPLLKFNGKALIKGESDASSFPSGGLRATFEARGYTVWDPTSYAFIKDCTLYIPTAFCSYGGEALDKKTPLLRSMEVLDRETKRLLKLFGIQVEKITPTVGAEQEYFLISKEVYEKRRDLFTCGRTLFGAKPPKGQELDDHYFGKIKSSIANFMKDLDKELWALGIYSKTEHNEAAPAQHELAPIFTGANIATDHNQLTMAVIKDVANRHGMVCLLHEKPFAGVNGSGKHNNWSITTDTGINLLEPGKNPSKNYLFLLILTAVVKAVDEYQDLLRISVASPSNDHRLGSNEAPPAIVSMFLGEELCRILESIESDGKYDEMIAEEMQTGVSVITHFDRDKSDRNRTSPFAFTGNKFEFRMLGSMQSIAEPNIVLNTIVGDTIKEFSEELEKCNDLEAGVKNIIKREYHLHKRIVFNGNNYSDEWVKEAKDRGLSNLATTVDAVEKLLEEKNVNLFERNKVYQKQELCARYEIMLESYCKQIIIEGETLLDIINKEVIPCAIEYKNSVASTILNLKNIGIKDIGSELERELLNSLCHKTDAIFEISKNLHNAIDFAFKTDEVLSKSKICKDEVLKYMNDLRLIVDDLESIVSKKFWSLPDYSDILYSIKY